MQLASDAGGIGFEPSSEFIKDLLQGRKAEIGLFIEQLDMNRFNADVTPFHNFNAGEMTIGYGRIEHNR